MVLGAWNSSYRAQNCYAYAIGYYETRNPGQIVLEVNGASDPFPQIHYNSILSIVEYVEEDLDALGYENIDHDTTGPDSQVVITEHNRVICVRREETTSGDYHFMVLEEDGMWYHKFAGCVPMRYLYTPSNDEGWVYEGLDEEGYFREEDTVYASLIYYIYYTIPCTMEYILYGDDMHLLICTGCGKTPGMASFCTYVDGKCSVCGRRQTISQQSLPAENG